MQTNLNRLSYLIILLISVSMLVGFGGCIKDHHSATGNPPPQSDPKIIYTNIDPDTIVLQFGGAQIYNLDLDNDGITDFVFNRNTQNSICNTDFMYHLGVMTFSVAPGTVNNSIIGREGTYASVLDSLAPINNDSLWATTSETLFTGARGSSRCVAPYQNTGYWFNITGDKYLGLKFMKGGNIYYGWVRLSTPFIFNPNPELRDGQAIVKDYAYNATTNQPILAGQK